MDARAAIALEAGKPPAVDRTRLQGSQASEVLIGIEAVICRMNTRIFRAAAAALLAGCAGAQPARLEIPNTAEVFSGSTTADASNWTGTISLASAGGVTCHGALAFANPWQGAGDMTCSDDRTGSFRFTWHGTGTGELGGKTIVVRLGAETE